MDSFEFNKIAGAVLGTALAVFGLRELSGVVYHAGHPEKEGFLIEVAEATEGEAGGGEAEAGEAKPLGELLKTAVLANGEKGAKACAACHNFEKGGPNKVGPNLWDVVERARGSHEGFQYSEAMKSKADPWTYEALDAFLAAPKAYVPGTKMSYGGMKNPANRADVLAYLQSLSDAPKPFPAP
jgi:cytochrome c